MENGAPKKPVVVSDRFWESYNSVYEQGLDLFGYFQAEAYAASSINRIKQTRKIQIE
jgi:hypothetical protein